MICNFSAAFSITTQDLVSFSNTRSASVLLANSFCGVFFKLTFLSWKALPPYPYMWPFFSYTKTQLKCFFQKLSYKCLSSVQLLSCVQLCDPMVYSMPGFPIHHQHMKLTQTLVHWVGDAIQPSHSLSSPSPPAFNLSQHQGLFKWVSTSHQVAKVLEFQLQHQSFQWTLRTDLL